MRDFEAYTSAAHAMFESHFNRSAVRSDSGARGGFCQAGPRGTCARSASMRSAAVVN